MTQRIGIVFETPENGTDQDTIDLFRRKLRRLYKGVHFRARAEISNVMEVPENLLEAAHDTASRAEDEQRKTGSNFVAYLRPLKTLLEFSDNDIEADDEDATIVLIAVAHSRGIGAFCISRPIAQKSMPADTCALFIEQKAEAEDVMRPRTKDPDNESAALLGARISDILDEIAPRA